MQRHIAEQIPETYLCPFCQFTGGDWDQVIDHMVDCHTDGEAYEAYAIRKPIVKEETLRKKKKVKQ
jgi:hypothetical protein